MDKSKSTTHAATESESTDVKAPYLNLNSNDKTGKNLSETASKGALVATLGSWLRFLFQFSTVIIVARILGPTQYASAALVTTVMGLAEILRMSGLNTAIVQVKDISNSQIVTLDRVSKIIGAIAGIFTATLSPLYKVFVGDYWLATGISLGIVFLLRGSATVPTGLLVRNMNVATLTNSEITAMMAGCAVAITTALLSAGPFCLVAQALTNSIVLWAMARFKWKRPSDKTASLQGISDLLKFGGFSGFTQVLSTLTRNADRIIVAYLFGPGAAGIYSQANQLLTIPLEQVNGPLQRIALPVMCKVFPSPNTFRQTYQKILKIVSLILWPAFTVLGILSPQIIALLFGSDWTASATIFRFLVLSGMAQAVGYVSVWLFVSSGNVHRQAVWTLISRPIVLLSFLAGTPWGLPGVAAAFSICSTIITIPTFLIAKHGTSLKINDLFSPLLWPAGIATLTAGGCCFGVTLFTEPIPQLIAGLLFAVFSWFAGSLIIPNTRILLLGFVRDIRNNDSRSGKATSNA